MEENKRLESFIKTVSKLEPIEFMGLAHMLCIDLAEDNKPKTGSVLVKEVIDKFSHLSASKQKELLKFCKKATRGQSYGNRTKVKQPEKEDVSSENV